MSFAPPTKDELKKHSSSDFAPVTEDEIKKHSGGDYDITGRGLLKGALEALPIAGGMAGGTLGLSGGPGGAFIGGTLGASLGKSLENLGEQYLLDESKTTEQLYTDPLAEAAGAAVGEGVLPVAGSIVKGAGSAIGSGLKKLSSELSGIPEKAFDTYLKRPKAVEKLGDVHDGTAMQDAADELRAGAVAAIQDAKNAANDEIYWILRNNGDKRVNVKPIIDSANSVIKDLNPKIRSHAEQINKIQDMVNQITELQVAPGVPFLKTSEVQHLKNILQDASEYTADGIVKHKRDLSDVAFKRMARDARLLVESVAPEIRRENVKLAKLHNINKKVNKNLLTPEKTAASVMAVGSGANQQSIKQMKKLEEITNFPYVESAENLTAAQYFNNPSIFPVQTTGRSMLASGAASTGMIGSALSGDVAPAIIGSAIGATGSPKVIKMGLDAVRSANQAGSYVMREAQSAVSMAEQLMKRAIQSGIPPYLIDNEIKNSNELTPTEKASLRMKNSKFTQ